ncbi:MAG: OmpA family protein [Crocinitomicaceae bacterium]|nr:OmpA family protein [Crocinitomicaceae bacterium]
MTKVVILLIILLASTPLFGQRKVGKDAVNMNSCQGAINIFDDGDFDMQFTGRGDNSIKGYPSLKGIDEENFLWISFIAPSEGDLTFTGSVKKGYLQMVIFQEMSGAICIDLDNASAEILRLNLSKNNALVGLDYKVDSSYLYSLHLEKGKKIHLLFATNEKSKKDLLLQWKFIPENRVQSESKIVDKRDDDFAPTLSFKIRDGESGLPLIAGLVIEGQKGIQGLYTGSDFFFSISRRVDLTIQCDIEGYFFHDSIYEITGTEDIEISIAMDPVAAGKSLQIEEIEFIPGSSEIMVSSEPKLRRLKDFLALNSELHIEIQGHVFALGDNSYAAQKVSEARAKRVMKYLIENGIDKKRLKAVGYGNTRPVYKEPVRFYQEQANRRVEIVVL